MAERPDYKLDAKYLWRSLVIVRGMADGLLNVILKYGSDQQKAMALVILDNAREMEDSRFNPPYPDLTPELRVKPVKVARRCLKCDKVTRMPTADRICRACRIAQAGAINDVPETTQLVLPMFPVKAS